LSKAAVNGKDFDKILNTYATWQEKGRSTNAPLPTDQRLLTLDRK